MIICIVSFMVWLHHFFTMGAGANINAMFGIASMIIGIPTGVKIYNWLFTMYGGRAASRFRVHYLLGFMLLFVGGGLTACCSPFRRSISSHTTPCSWWRTSTT